LGGTPVYINIRQPDVILWMDGARTEVCHHRPTIAEFLAGYGFESRKPPEKVAEAEGRARQWSGLARELAAHALPDDLIQFRDDAEREKARKRGIALEDRHLSPAWRQIDPIRLA